MRRQRANRKTASPLRSRARRLRHRSDEGFGIIDIAVTVAVIAVVLIPLSDILGVSENAVVTGRDDVVAINLASQQLQAASATPFSLLIQNQYGQTTSTQVVGGVKYTIKQNVEWVGQGSTTNNCVSGAAAASQIVRVVASVYWNTAGLGVPVSEATTISPAITSEPSSTGLALPLLTSATGTGVSGATVTLTATGFTTTSLTTGSDGCAYFPNLTGGKTYTATVSESGYVSQQEMTTQSVSSVVATGSTVVLAPLYYAPAGTLTVSATTPSTLTPATGMTYSVGNTALQPLGWFSGTTNQFTLYPLSGGYSTWAGNCEDSDPQGSPGGTGTPYYPGTPTPTAVQVVSGQGAVTTAALYALPISVVTTAGAPVASAVSTAAPTGTNCASPTANYGLVATAATGLSTTGMPLGNYKVSVTAGAKKGSATVLITPTGIETSAGAPITGALVIQVS